MFVESFYVNEEPFTNGNSKEGKNIYMFRKDQLYNIRLRVKKFA